MKELETAIKERESVKSGLDLYKCPQFSWARNHLPKQNREKRLDYIIQFIESTPHFDKVF
jgi:hypothetical protein